MQGNDTSYMNHDENHSVDLMTAVLENAMQIGKWSCAHTIYHACIASYSYSCMG